MPSSRTFKRFSRRTALVGLGASSLGVAIGRDPVIAQEATPAAIQTNSGVVYGEVEGQQLLLDFASLPVGSEPRPAVILIHGGGFEIGSRAGLLAPLAPALAKAGYVVFNIDYRLFVEDSGANLWPAQLVDSQRAVRWIRSNAATYGVDPERLASFGHSSGAQLAAFLGLRETVDNSIAELAGFSSLVNCVVDVAGPMDMTIPSPDPGTNATTVAILGGTADTPPDSQAIADFSPITFFNNQAVPFLLVRGLDDADLPAEHQRSMATSLQEVGRETITAELTGFDHISILNWSALGPWVTAFLDRNLFDIPSAIG